MIVRLNYTFETHIKKKSHKSYNIFQEIQDVVNSENWIYFLSIDISKSVSKLIKIKEL